MPCAVPGRAHSTPAVAPVLASRLMAACDIGRPDLDTLSGCARNELVHRDVGEQPAFPNHDQVVGGVLELAHVVSRDNTVRPSAAKPSKGLAHPLDAFGVEADRGLVQDQDRRIPEERAGDAETLPHPERERSGPSPGDLRKSHEPEHVVGSPGVNTVAVGEPAEVAPRRAARMERSSVEQCPDDGQGPLDRPVALALNERLARSAETRPSSRCIVVVLPAPFGPTKPVTRPGRTAIERSSSASVRPYRLVSPCVSTAASTSVDGSDRGALDRVARGG